GGGRVERGGGDFGARGGEELRNLLADVATRASDDRHLILELHALAPRRRPAVITFAAGRLQHGRRPRGTATNMIGELLKDNGLRRDCAAQDRRSIYRRHDDARDRAAGEKCRAHTRARFYGAEGQSPGGDGRGTPRA